MICFLCNRRQKQRRQLGLERELFEVNNQLNAAVCKLTNQTDKESNDDEKKTSTLSYALAAAVVKQQQQHAGLWISECLTNDLKELNESTSTDCQFNRQ